jgi:hypothetical protein
VFPNPYREDPGKALRDWDLWGPFFFIVFLGLTLSWSASVKKVRTSFQLCSLEVGTFVDAEPCTLAMRLCDRFVNLES